MGMTEKQGGSDVRANLTEARPTSVDGEYTLHGHKWFTSAPMNDVFLVLARTAGGLTCFLVPRVLPSGERNRLAVVRLKDKLGNRSNASSELELDGTWAQRLGDEGRGVRTIIEMVAATRLDCVLGSASLMRRALAEASWHVAHRSAFGGLLADKPLMQNVVADLAVESEAATALGIRLAAAVDDLGDPHEAALRRIALPPGQVLGLQAHPDDGGRGARVPGRQRVRRGVRDAPALPGVPAELDLGRLGQRQRARRPARPLAGAGGARRLADRGGPRPR
jgi:putative acyl-CoA dehydrogenase